MPFLLPTLNKKAPMSAPMMLSSTAKFFPPIENETERLSLPRNGTFYSLDELLSFAAETDSAHDSGCGGMTNSISNTSSSATYKSFNSSGTASHFFPMESMVRGFQGLNLSSDTCKHPQDLPPPRNGTFYSWSELSQLAV